MYSHFSILMHVHVDTCACIYKYMYMIVLGYNLHSCIGPNFTVFRFCFTNVSYLLSPLECANK